VVFDCASDRPSASTVSIAPDGAILIVDGLFLNRDELRGYWDVSIFLDVPFEITTQRCAQRDGTVADYRHESNRRYVEARCVIYKNAGRKIERRSLSTTRISRGRYGCVESIVDLG
jgi:uridine kinase